MQQKNIDLLEGIEGMKCTFFKRNKWILIKINVKIIIFPIISIAQKWLRS